jgi:drug/metabolite transporter (DMT)-like permease
MKILFPYTMALIAYSLLSIGFVLQKKGIHWIGWKANKDRVFYRHLFTWIIGFVIMNIYGIPSAIALKSLPPHIVSAFAGWGIVMLVFFSYLILKEKLFPGDYLFAFLIVAGIFILGYFEPITKPGTQSFSLWGLVLLSLLPVIVFSIAFLKTIIKKIQTASFASVSGMTAGLMVVFLRLLVLNHGYEVLRYFASPYLYLYILFALLSLISLQLALKNGAMIAIGPVQYASNIIYPLIATLVVFQQSIYPIQVIAIALIVFSVTRILKHH